MPQATRWSTQFKIQDDALSGYAQEAKAAGADLLHWCLMNGKVPQDRYLDWAMKAFELPTLRGDFFTAPPDLEFWSKTRSLGSWSPSLFPVSEWNGCLFIACLEPPTEFKISKQHRFVLASARHLFLLWDQLNGASNGTSQAKIAAPPTPVANAAPAKPVNETPPVIAMPPAASAETPQTLVLENTTPDFSRQMPHEDSAVTAVQESFEDQPTAVLMLQPEGETNASAVSKPENESTQKITGETAPVVMREPKPLAACASKVDLGAIVLTHILTMFEGAMIFTLDKNSLKPWLFSDLFRSEIRSEKSEDLESIETETPSIFRIALRTRLPYHGYVTPSPTNDAFFNSYLGGQLPKHATLVPVLVGNNFFGILMGVSAKEIEYKSSLIHMQRLADEMAQHLKRLQQSNAA